LASIQNQFWNERDHIHTLPALAMVGRGVLKALFKTPTLNQSSESDLSLGQLQKLANFLPFQPDVRKQ
jgi:hypothetical protein